MNNSNNHAKLFEFFDIEDMFTEQGTHFHLTACQDFAIGARAAIIKLNVAAVYAECYGHMRKGVDV